MFCLFYIGSIVSVDLNFLIGWMVYLNDIIIERKVIIFFRVVYNKILLGWRL